MRHLLLLVALLSVGGCFHKPNKLIQQSQRLVVNPNLPNVITWSADVNQDAMRYWLTEARRRFTNPIVFAAHGGYEFVENKVGDLTVIELQWWIYPDAPRKPMSAQAAAETLANMYPDRDIVFTACNKNGFPLRVKRVFYAKKEVWIVPDDFQPSFKHMRHETGRDNDAVGSIWEFVAYDGHKAEPSYEILTAATTKPATQPTTHPTTQPASDKLD